MGGGGIGKILAQRPGIFLHLGGFRNGIHRADVNSQAGAAFVALVLIHDADKVCKANGPCRAIGLAASAADTDFLMNDQGKLPYR